MTQALFRMHEMWTALMSDRGLAYVAIIVGVGGILRADWLFHKLYKREKYIREAILMESRTVFLSYAAFSRALQGVDLNEGNLNKDGAFALLTSFRIQQLLFPNATSEEQKELRRTTREQIEKSAREYAEMIVNADMGKLKDRVEFNPEFKK